MSESSSLASATARLEEGDTSLSSVDLRGKGRRAPRCGRERERSDAPVPRPKIRRFAAALVGRHSSPPTRPPSSSLPSCRLSYLALHNRFLDPCELPLLFDALSFIPSLETLVLFHHDVGDDGVDSLMRSLARPGDDGGEVTSRGGDGIDDEMAWDGGAVCETKRNASWGLRELYLSHCNIGCAGARSIADALDRSSYEDDGKLKHLQVLSLGSNRIGETGARALVGAFGRHPSLERMVLHGNKCIDSSASSSIHATISEEELKIPLCHRALVPAGWRSELQPTTPTARAMEVFVPLILPHVRRRWEEDRVLVRPHDHLRRRLREEMLHGKDSASFVDDRLEALPDVLAWMGREGACRRRTSLHSSQSLRLRGRGTLCHSSGREACRACAAVHLNDLRELFTRMPHIVSLLRGISAPRVEGDGAWQDGRGGYL